jgi:hypothetical protein
MNFFEWFAVGYATIMLAVVVDFYLHGGIKNQDYTPTSWYSKLLVFVYWPHLALVVCLCVLGFKNVAAICYEFFLYLHQVKMFAGDREITPEYIRQF